MTERNLEYRRVNKEDGKYKIGLFVKGMDMCVMMYNGYITGNGETMKLYPNRRGEATVSITNIPGKHNVSIFKIKD